MRILHVYRNTPLGRETLIGAAYLCRRTGMQLSVSIPHQDRFALNFDQDLVEIQLDKSYLSSPDTAVERAQTLLESQGQPLRLVEPTHKVASTLPELPADFHMMTSPRSVSDPPSPLVPPILGSRVRRLVRAASFPILVLHAPALEWDRVVTFFDGSEHALHALHWGRTIASSAGVPFEVFTVDEGKAARRARSALKKAGLLAEIEPVWRVIEGGSFIEALWEVPRKALVTAGAYGHWALTATVHESRTELLQSRLPNPILLVGPNSGEPKV